MMLAVHAHAVPCATLTVNVAVPPAVGRVTNVGETSNTQVVGATASCVIMIVCPATVAVPVRAGPLFSETMNVTVSFPACEGSPFMLTNKLTGIAVQVQLLPCVTLTVTVTLPPIAGSCAASGLTFNAHGPGGGGDGGAGAGGCGAGPGVGVGPGAGPGPGSGFGVGAGAGVGPGFGGAGLGVLPSAGAPSCVTFTVTDPIRICALRSVAEFAETRTSTTPFPVPDPPATIVTKSSVGSAVHAQDGPVATLTLNVPPSWPTFRVS